MTSSPLQLPDATSPPCGGCAFAGAESPIGGKVAYERRKAAQIVEMCRVAGAALRVNFQRATDPAHIAVRNEVENVPLGANAKIGGGHFNYGSHVVDLVLDWFGAARSVSAFPIAARAKSPDDEPALDFRISLEAGFECLIQSVSGAHFDIFEIEAYSKIGRSVSVMAASRSIGAVP